MKIQITLRGKTLDVHGEFNEAENGGYEYPSSPAYFEAQEVWIDDHDFTEFMTGADWEKIDSLCAEEIENETI